MILCLESYSGSEKLVTSKPTEETKETVVEEGATIGARAVIGCGITLAEYCMVGMGSVVTKDILPYSLVYGVPAEVKGYVCRCGYPLKLKKNSAICSYCKSRYFVSRRKNIIKIRPT